MKPQEIETESFRIILEELGLHSFSAEELPVVQRVIHATADFEYADLLRFSDNAIQDGVQALRRGCPIICDVRMITAGIQHTVLRSFGNEILCAIDDVNVQQRANEMGQTRATLAMRLLSNQMQGAVIAIGNAPTALFEVMELAQEEHIRPALVVGVPVGFVNALESKAALASTSLNYITCLGRKGGSSVAVAIINALLRLGGV